MAPLTGGLSLPLALHASHRKRYGDNQNNLLCVVLSDIRRRVSRRIRDSAASDVHDLRARIHELKKYQKQLGPQIKKVHDMTKELERAKMLAGETARKNTNLCELVRQQCDEYLGLKDKAMKMVSQTRSLEARVKTLTYAEGADEVKTVIKGLDDDLKQMTLKSISHLPWDD